MRGRYVLTSTCLHTGTMSLTRTLREMLEGVERARFVDEDGEVWECWVNRSDGRVEGLAPYYQKRRLGINDIIWLTLQEDGSIALEAATARQPKSRPAAAAKAEPAREPVEVEAQASGRPAPKRVRVTPYPKTVLYPQEGNEPPPAYVQALEALGFQRVQDLRAPIYRAHLGRRGYALALGRYGEVDLKDLLAARREGQVAYAAVAVTESEKEAVKAELRELRLALVTPEALAHLARLRSLFPVGPVELERLLKQGRVDLDAVEELAHEIDRWVGERAAFSTVLIALTDYPAQQVFLLEDLMENLGESGIDRETVASILEVLAGPPFLLLRRLAPGEYLLRETVADALGHLAEYALSLRNRLMS